MILIELLNRDQHNNHLLSQTFMQTKEPMVRQHHLQMANPKMIITTTKRLASGRRTKALSPNLLKKSLQESRGLEEFFTLHPIVQYSRLSMWQEVVTQVVIQLLPTPGDNTFPSVVVPS